MAHQPHSQDPANAIFSPSVARIAASNARDWSYVDSWLASKFRGRPVPSFERNPDTLRALLSLASANEAADEERSLSTRANLISLRELESHSNHDSMLQGLADGLLSNLAHELPREGRLALDTMAEIAVDAGIASPEPCNLGSRLTKLHLLLCEAEEMKVRVDILQSHLDRDAQRMQALIRQLQTNPFQPPPDLAKQNLELQRKVKATAAQLPELCDRATSLASSVLANHPTVDQIASDEKEYCDILAQKRQLDLQLAAFEGLHSDPDMARAELDALRSKLRGATTRRDAVFEGLVERESPVKRR